MGSRCCAAAAGIVLLPVTAGCTVEVHPRAGALGMALPEQWRIDYATDSGATLFDIGPGVQG
jgi:hypothetical protein